MEKKLLSEEKKVYTKDNMVIRPLGPWSKNIHLLLKHLYDKGLPVPGIIKTDADYEYLEYIEGEQVHPHKWTDEGLYEIGKLVRAIHDSVTDFKNESTMEWKPWYLRELGRPEICSHGDIAPWNIITKNGKPIGIIDWEFAGPIDPVIELARVCWLFPQLHDDDLGELYELPSPSERGKQVKIILDAYGLDTDKRKGFVEKIMETIICETAHEAIDSGITFDSEGNLWEWPGGTGAYTGYCGIKKCWKKP
ncbi:aminoglycoside phosphotransferase family protein [Brucepastera parasyntrophica]|uniref:aminoglycoside phosphotransferase family protein n=1 Tax=Brucepastera parasyntrophica TaxID=2880008 RepID=UPI00210C0C34|nr:aminoglycoside phosphotransferase family protein [Brucepastera parasyntrophica]ULQ58574.1 aminoglycoside phosphotransferase family protein [Brucepastera parasyntrophica]